MISPRRHQQRRKKLCSEISHPILLMGHGHRSRNFQANTLPFRQESNFLYFTGCTLPNSALYMDHEKEILFLKPKDADDALWHGPSLSIEELADKLGFSKVVDIAQLPKYIDIHTTQSIATQDLRVNQSLEQILNRSFHSGSVPEQWGDLGLIKSIAKQRIQLDEEEIQEMRNTANITKQAHIAAMKATKVGVTEMHVASVFHQIIASEGLPGRPNPRYSR